jgi:hypothetical protein
MMMMMMMTTTTLVAGKGAHMTDIKLSLPYDSIEVTGQNPRGVMYERILFQVKQSFIFNSSWCMNVLKRFPSRSLWAQRLVACI